jgi:hypothetical protein
MQVSPSYIRMRTTNAYNSNGSSVDRRQRQVGTLYFPDLDCIKPMVRFMLTVIAIVRSRLWYQVLLEELRVFLKILITESCANL